MFLQFQCIDIFLATTRKFSFYVIWQTWLFLQIWRVFSAHFYSKRDCVGENIHQQNANLPGVTNFFIVNVYTRFTRKLSLSAKIKFMLRLRLRYEN